MSLIYPKNPSFSTYGEELLYSKVLKELPDDWHIFYEPMINGKKPDFILFHPRYGLILLEVKDYTKTTIQSMNPLQWEIKANGMLKVIKSPMQQVTYYRNETYNLLSQNELLRVQEGNFKGRLKIPVSSMCCFPLLSQRDIQDLKIHHFIPIDLIISQEETVDLELFLVKLYQAQKRLFVPGPLTNKEILGVIQLIYPEFRHDHKERNLNYTNTLDTMALERFDNHVDELLYIADCVAHFYNFEQKPLHEIAILFNQKRASIPTSKKYLELLIDLLKSKNLLTSFDAYAQDKVLLFSYETLKQMGPTPKFIFMIDFNLIAQDILQNDVLPLIDKQRKQASFVITSNAPIYSTKQD